MQKAAELLAKTDDQVESVASAVGYANAFVFSNTFKRWVGWRPSEYRKKDHHHHVTQGSSEPALPKAGLRVTARSRSRLGRRILGGTPKEIAASVCFCVICRRRLRMLRPGGCRRRKPPA